MDHLPEVQNSTVKPIQVPLLCDSDQHFRYDGQDWATYPRRVGWSDADIMALPPDIGQDGTKSPADINSFLQAWLYFGLLSSVLGFHVKEDWLSRQGETGQMVLCTKLLPDLIDEGLDRIKKLNNKESIDDIDIRPQKLCLSQAKLWWDNCTGLETDEDLQRYGVDPLVMVSIQVLHESLYFAFLMNGTRFKADTLGWRAITKDWCPSDIAWMGQQFGASARCYAMRFPPRSSSLDHQSCSERECLALNIDENDYDVRHQTWCTGCSDVISSSELICDALSNNSFPLLYVTGDFPQGLRCFVKTFEPGDIYVAISHVWCDGLGNPSMNKLPRCHAWWLQQTAIAHIELLGIRSPNKAILFWIDTLCVPCPDVRGLRKVAISRMGQIYQEASLVLVLDRELQSRDVKSLYQELQKSTQARAEESYQLRPGKKHLMGTQPLFVQLCMIILLSNWRRRLWTLQESVFARKLVFMFRDVSIEFDSLWNWHFARGLRLIQGAKRQKVKFNDVEEEILQQFAHAIGQGIRTPAWKENGASISWFHLRDPSKSSDAAIYGVYAGCQERQTSHQRDQFVCLGTLLRFDPSRLRRIQDADDDDRFAMFLHSQPTFPSAFIFAMCPRMPQQGLRWCPFPFVNRVAYAKIAPELKYTETNIVGTKVPAGLLVTFFGIHFTVRWEQDTATLVITDQTNPSDRYCVLPAHGYFEESLHYQRLRSSTRSLGLGLHVPCQSASHLLMSNAGLYNLAIILRSSPSEAGIPGLLARLLFEEDGVKYVETLQEVFVGRLVDGEATLGTPGFGGPAGEYTWCVD